MAHKKSPQNVENKNSILVVPQWVLKPRWPAVFIAVALLLVIVSITAPFTPAVSSVTPVVDISPTVLPFYTPGVVEAPSPVEAPSTLFVTIPTPVNIGSFGIDPAVLEAVMTNFYTMPLAPIITVNIEELRLTTANDKEVMFAAALMAGDMNLLSETGSWFSVQEPGTPGAKAREDIASAIETVTYQNMTMADAVWVGNMAWGLRALNYPDRAVSLQDSYKNFVSSATVSLPNSATLPVTRENVTLAIQQDLITDTFAPSFTVMAIGSSMDQGVGISYSRPLLWYNMHRIYSLIMEQQYSPMPKTPYVREVSHLNIMPLLWDEKTITVPVLGEVSKALMLLSDSPDVDPVPTHTQWVQYMGPDRQFYEGYVLGPDGKQHYWRAVMIYYINGFTVEVGDVLPQEVTAMDFIEGLFSNNP